MTLNIYFKEIGRAGRDGKDAFCHAFLSQEDYIKHRSFAHSEGVDMSSIWKFVLQIFSRDASGASILSKNMSSKTKIHCESSEVMSAFVNGKHNLVIPIKEAERELDAKENVLATMLNYIESDAMKPIRFLQSNSKKKYLSFFKHFCVYK